MDGWRYRDDGLPNICGSEWLVDEAITHGAIALCLGLNEGRRPVIR
jgi:hypothetical protein